MWGGGGGGTARTRGRRRALRAHGGAASPPMCRQRSRGSCAAHAWRGEGARSGPFSGAPRAPIRCAAPMPRLRPVPRAPSHAYPVSPARGGPVSRPTEVREPQPRGGPAWGRCWGREWGRITGRDGDRAGLQTDGSGKRGAAGSSAWSHCSKRGGDTGGGSMQSTGGMWQKELRWGWGRRAWVTRRHIAQPQRTPHVLGTPHLGHVALCTSVLRKPPLTAHLSWSRHGPSQPHAQPCWVYRGLSYTCAGEQPCPRTSVTVHTVSPCTSVRGNTDGAAHICPHHSAASAHPTRVTASPAPHPTSPPHLPTSPPHRSPPLPFPLATPPTRSPAPLR